MTPTKKLKVCPSCCADGIKSGEHEPAEVCADCIAERQAKGLCASGLPQRCVVCGDPCEGFWAMPWRASTGLPVCESCFDHGDKDGEFIAWFERVQAKLKLAPAVIPSPWTGNMVRDLETLEAMQRMDARIEEGVCPNGCGFVLEPNAELPRESECPRCGFVLVAATLLMP